MCERKGVGGEGKREKSDVFIRGGKGIRVFCLCLGRGEEYKRKVLNNAYTHEGLYIIYIYIYQCLVSHIYTVLNNPYSHEGLYLIYIYISHSLVTHVYTALHNPFSLELLYFIYIYISCLIYTSYHTLHPLFSSFLCLFYLY